MIHKVPNQLSENDCPRPVVCRMCGAALEVVVSFTGKIVWSIDPNDPNFGTQVPSLRGETKGVRVVCSADIMHACGFVCLDGVLREAAKKQ